MKFITQYVCQIPTQPADQSTVTVNHYVTSLYNSTLYVTTASFTYTKSLEKKSGIVIRMN